MNLFKKSRKKNTIGKIEVGVKVKRCDKCDGHTRLCTVSGERAYFHRWIEEEKVIVQMKNFTSIEEMIKFRKKVEDEGISPLGCGIEKAKVIEALVEYMDGTVKKVAPEQVKFVREQE